jgi:hypothetical protein
VRPNIYRNFSYKEQQQCTKQRSYDSGSHQADPLSLLAALLQAVVPEQEVQVQAPAVQAAERFVKEEDNR